jgi:hypothetical protein
MYPKEATLRRLLDNSVLVILLVAVRNFVYGVFAFLSHLNTK